VAASHTTPMLKGKCSAASPVLHSKLPQVQLCLLQITAHCPDRSRYDSADRDPGAGNPRKDGPCPAWLLVAICPPAWKAPALVAASTEEKARPSPCCHTSQTDRLALTPGSLGEKSGQ